MDPFAVVDAEIAASSSNHMGGLSVAEQEELERLEREFAEAGSSSLDPQEPLPIHNNNNNNSSDNQAVSEEQSAAVAAAAAATALKLGNEVLTVASIRAEHPSGRLSFSHSRPVSGQNLDDKEKERPDVLLLEQELNAGSRPSSSLQLQVSSDQPIANAKPSSSLRLDSANAGMKPLSGNFSSQDQQQQQQQQPRPASKLNLQEVVVSPAADRAASPAPSPQPQQRQARPAGSGSLAAPAPIEPDRPQSLRDFSEDDWKGKFLYLQQKHKQLEELHVHSQAIEEELERHVTDVERELTEARERLEGRTHEYADLQARAAAASTERDSQHAQYAELESLLQRMAKHNETLENKSEKRVTELQAHLQESEKRCSRADTEIAALQREMHKFQADSSTLKDQIRFFESENDKLQKKNRIEKAYREAFEEKYREAEERAALLENDLNEAHNEKADAIRKLKEELPYEPVREMIRHSSQRAMFREALEQLPEAERNAFLLSAVGNDLDDSTIAAAAAAAVAATPARSRGMSEQPMGTPTVAEAILARASVTGIPMAAAHSLPPALARLASATATPNLIRNASLNIPSLHLPPLNPERLTPRQQAAAAYLGRPISTTALDLHMPAPSTAAGMVAARRNSLSGRGGNSAAGLLLEKPVSAMEMGSATVEDPYSGFVVRVKQEEQGGESEAEAGASGTNDHRDLPDMSRDTTEVSVSGRERGASESMSRNSAVASSSDTSKLIPKKTEDTARGKGRCCGACGGGTAETPQGSSCIIS